MQAAIEISMYPLQETYEAPILAFIERLRQHPEIEIETNRLSTQLFGEYDLLMEVLSAEMRRSFEAKSTTVMVLKVVHIAGV